MTRLGRDSLTCQRRMSFCRVQLPHTSFVCKRHLLGHVGMSFFGLMLKGDICVMVKRPLHLGLVGMVIDPFGSFDIVRVSIKGIVTDVKWMVSF